MKSRLYDMAIMAMATLGFAACSNDEEANPSVNDSNIVHITAQIGNVNGSFITKSNPIGTEEEQKVFNTNDQIAVAAGSQAAVTYTLGSDGGWGAESGKCLTWETTPMTFQAYYPVGKNNASMTSFTLPSSYNSIEDLADADYMTCTANVAKTNTVTLNMERKMARLVIDKITFKDQFASGYKVTSIKVNTTTFRYNEGEVETINELYPVSTFKHTDGKYYALLIPSKKDDSAINAGPDDEFLTITVTPTEGGASQELTIKGNPVMKAGYSYTYELTVGKSIATVSKVTVADWSNGGTITGGEANENKV